MDTGVSAAIGLTTTDAFGTLHPTEDALDNTAEGMKLYKEGDDHSSASALYARMWSREGRRTTPATTLFFLETRRPT